MENASLALSKTTSQCLKFSKFGLYQTCEESKWQSTLTHAPCNTLSIQIRRNLFQIPISKNWQEQGTPRWANTSTQSFMYKCCVKSHANSQNLTINHSLPSPLHFIKGSIYSPERWPKLTRNICTLLGTSVLREPTLPQTTTSLERKEMPASAT